MKYRLICIIMSAAMVFSSCGLLNKNKNHASDQLENETTTVQDAKPVDNQNTTQKPADQEPAKTEDSQQNTQQNVQQNPQLNNQNQSTASLNKTEKSWYYNPKSNGEPSGEPGDIITLINKYNGYYLGDTSQKIMYLTFDEGYENGYTSKILDILKGNNVKAAFFVTKPYITANKDLIKRMVAEGHLVCNHSNTHPSMPSVAIKGQSAFDKEFTDTEAAFTEVTGKEMPKFFRPPMGNYSELSLYYTNALGYKSIFWSFAYKDWETNNQPDEAYAKNLMKQRTHNGAILLLHAVSKTNTNILDSMLKEWKSNGYDFKTLYELPNK